MTKTLTIELQVTGSDLEIDKEMGFILKMIESSKFSRLIGHSVIDGKISYGVLHSESFAFAKRGKS